jgi:translation initiation factor 1A
MPKNTIGGKGHKKGKRFATFTRDLPLQEDGTDYAYVLDVLGGGRMRVHCFNDNQDRIGTIRGSMYKKVWIAKDDVVLVSLRGYQDSKCDIVFKYNGDEVKLLVRQKELPGNFSMIAKKDATTNDEMVMFEDEQSERESDVDLNKNLDILIDAI